MRTYTVALKQVAFGKSMFKENAKMANLAADFVVNDIIVNIKGTVAGSSELIVELPDGGVYDPMFTTGRCVRSTTISSNTPKPKPSNRAASHRKVRVSSKIRIASHPRWRAR